ILKYFFVALIIAKIAMYSIFLYNVYVRFTHVPDLPNVDLNKWWGPNVTQEVDTSIRPYRIVFSDAMETELRALFEDYRNIIKKTKSFEDAGWTYGVNSEAFAQFFSHWLFKYEFSKRVKFLNKFNHFITKVQGLDIHFVHVKPEVDKNVKVYPLLLLHGWPGSVREFFEAIPLLTSPRPGYDFVFEVIAPSLPGFIYSQAPTKPGLHPYQSAIILRNLMQRIGFKHYFVQGGGFGHTIGSNLATLFPNEVLGFHTNYPANLSKLSILTWLLGAIWPTLVTENVNGLYPLTDKVANFLEESGYTHLQRTKPDTIGIALQDSPVGLAAYIVEKFVIFTDPALKNTIERSIDKYYDLDKLLDNVMLYWVSGSITTSMRMFKESAGGLGDDFDEIPTLVPTWVLKCKHEPIQFPDFMLRWKYPNLAGSTRVDFGGQFAAFERPEEFTADVFKAVKAFVEVKK
ncbi:hypothetical protein O3G_MSEX015256, partial [Manduca sexta]